MPVFNEISVARALLADVYVAMGAVKVYVAMVVAAVVPAALS